VSFGPENMAVYLCGTRHEVRDVRNYLTCFASVATLNSINVASRQTVCCWCDLSSFSASLLSFVL